MRILFLVDVYPHPFKRYFDVQFENLAARGVDFEVASLAELGGSKPLRPPDGIAVRRIYSFRARPAWCTLMAVAAMLRRPVRLLRLAAACIREGLGVRDLVRAWLVEGQLPRRSPDVLFSHNLAAAARTWFLPATRPELLVCLHYHGGELPGVPAIESPAAARAFAAQGIVFTNTRASGAEAVARGCDPGRIHIVPVGLKIDDFPFRQRVAPEFDADSPVKLLCVGRISAEKGFEFALRAVAILHGHYPHLAVDLAVVGDGPELAHLRALAEELGIESYVKFVGRLDHRGVADHFGEADVLLLPSVEANTWAENQATVAQEAMLTGLPVIASRIGGVPESLPPELQDYLCRQGDAQELAATICRFLALNREERERLRQRCREFVLASYDIDRTNGEVLRKLEAELRSRTLPPGPA